MDGPWARKPLEKTFLNSCPPVGYVNGYTDAFPSNPTSKDQSRSQIDQPRFLRPIAARLGLIRPTFNYCQNSKLRPMVRFAGHEPWASPRKMAQWLNSQHLVQESGASRVAWHCQLPISGSGPDERRHASITLPPERPCFKL